MLVFKKIQSLTKASNSMSNYACGAPPTNDRKTPQSLTASLGPRLAFSTRDPCRSSILNPTPSRTGNGTYCSRNSCGRFSIYATWTYCNRDPPGTLIQTDDVHSWVQTWYISRSTRRPPGRRKAEGLREPNKSMYRPTYSTLHPNPHY